MEHIDSAILHHMDNIEPIVLVHGGAGPIPDEHKAREMVKGVKRAAKTGYQALMSTGHVVDAVQFAVEVMENNEVFNAGNGSVLNVKGEVEMDACIMVGQDLNAGGVTAVKNIKNPIALARLVLDKTDHVLLAAEGARKFANVQGVQPLLPRAHLARASREGLGLGLGRPSSSRLDTVGAIAIDKNGRLAVATSTGGIEGKLEGRSSAACMLGCGIYADDNIGAVCATGHGESIAKFCLAHSIIKAMEVGEIAHAATINCVEQMTAKLNHGAGAISLSCTGDVGIAFTTNRMPWAYRRGDDMHFGIDKDQRERDTA